MERKKGKSNTNKRGDDEYDVESQATSSGNEEGGNGTDGDNDGSNGNGGEQLKGDYGVNFAYEGPAEFRVLKHHGIQRPNSSCFDIISFPHGLIPHVDGESGLPCFGD